MPLPATPARYWHTLRHLRPEQFYGRVKLRLARPRPDMSAAPATRTAHAPWKPCARPASMTGPDSFRFLGVERTITTAADWSCAHWPQLWLYNAHYFDDFAAPDAAAREPWHSALVSRWIAENPPGAGPGWHPYPTSLRIVNWVKWACRGGPLNQEAKLSLAVQVRLLRERLETHLLGNHLWANAKALLFAGAFFDGDEASGWLEDGLALVRRELAEQVLPDGGHFERSPMYHAVVLEDILDLVQLATVFPGLLADADTSCWTETGTRMLRWLRVMSHPDGGIALFNDAALGVAPDLRALVEYANALGQPAATGPLADIEALPESGYVRFEAGPAVLIADTAPIGPDYIPGHAHADTLSFELSLDGRRVLVNGGTSTYDDGEQRRRERSTAMHNTVEVDREDSSEVWAAFRVARRARPFGVRWGRDGKTLWLEAAHDGYRRLPGRVIHRRRWALQESRLQVADGLEGRFSEAVARFRFSPECSERQLDGTARVLTVGAQILRWSSVGQSAEALISDTWHPRFGASEPCQVLELAFCGPSLTSSFSWN